MQCVLKLIIMLTKKDHYFANKTKCLKQRHKREVEITLTLTTRVTSFLDGSSANEISRIKKGVLLLPFIHAFPELYCIFEELTLVVAAR